MPADATGANGNGSRAVERAAENAWLKLAGRGAMVALLPAMYWVHQSVEDLKSGVSDLHGDMKVLAEKVDGNHALNSQQFSNDEFRLAALERSLKDVWAALSRSRIDTAPDKAQP
jgi:hypothetical protein